MNPVWSAQGTPCSEEPQKYDSGGEGGGRQRLAAGFGWPKQAQHTRPFPHTQRNKEKASRRHSCRHWGTIWVRAAALGAKHLRRFSGKVTGKLSVKNVWRGYSGHPGRSGPINQIEYPVRIRLILVFSFVLFFCHKR